MEKSELYDLLDSGLLREWKDKAEKIDDCGFAKNEKEKLEEIEKELNEKSKKLLTSYSLAIENIIDYLNYIINNKILNLGIKIGMDLQKAFTEFE